MNNRWSTKYRIYPYPNEERPETSACAWTATYITCPYPHEFCPKIGEVTHSGICPCPDGGCPRVHQISHSIEDSRLDDLIALVEKLEKEVRLLRDQIKMVRG